MFVIRDARPPHRPSSSAALTAADLGALYQQAAGSRQNAAAWSAIFEAGFREFVETAQADRDPNWRCSWTAPARAMRATYQREITISRRTFPFSPTVGSVSPTSACSHSVGS